ncbi:MAG: T9SS type A sorting domain-containing protein [Bacteroidia bacterium]|nr:T9SS type A sorting domain-containing protein [Bacteroidia bacterium]
MKKALLLFAVAVLSIPAAAQSIRVENQESGGTVANGSTITYWIPALNGSGPWLDVRHFTVSNISNMTKTFKVRKMNITLANVAAQTTFCTDMNCYGPGQMLSYNIPMNSNASFDLSLDYNTGSVTGVTRVSYTIYDINNVNDSLMLTLEYNVANGPASVANNTLVKPSVSNPQPNPASEMFAINYKMGSTPPADAKLVVYNMLGAVVLESEITSAEGTIRMDVSTLPTGVYFCTLTNNGRQLATKRLAVTH